MKPPSHAPPPGPSRRFLDLLRSRGGVDPSRLRIGTIVLATMLYLGAAFGLGAFTGLPPAAGRRAGPGHVQPEPAAEPGSILPARGPEQRTRARGRGRRSGVGAEPASRTPGRGPASPPPRLSAPGGPGRRPAAHLRQPPDRRSRRGVLLVRHRPVDQELRERLP